MNDTYIDTHNPIFETLQELNTRKQHTNPTHYIKNNTNLKTHSYSGTQHKQDKSKYTLNYAKQ
jgi:hypothetical protein